MDEETAGALRRLSKKAISEAVSEDTRQAAITTGGLPVLSDMGGVLVVTPSGEVLHYDPEERTAKAVDERWRTVAFVKAALKHPGLRGLMPDRPPNALTCPQCRGTGVVLRALDCGNCMGTGWLQALPPA